MIIQFLPRNQNKGQKLFQELQDIQLQSQEGQGHGRPEMTPNYHKEHDWDQSPHQNSFSTLNQVSGPQN